MSTLPKGWIEAPLSKLTDKLVDGSHNPPPKAASGKPMLSARNIDQRSISFDNYRLIDEAAFEIEDKRTQIHPGDVLLTIVGAIGRSAVVPKDCPEFTLQRSVAVLGPNSAIDSNYLSYALEAPNLQSWLNDNAKGTAQKGIYLRALGEATIPLAPLAEQQRIVAKLDSLGARSSRIRSELDHIPTLIERYKQAILSKAFSGDLTADWRKANEIQKKMAMEEILRCRRDMWVRHKIDAGAKIGKILSGSLIARKYEEPSCQPEPRHHIPPGWTFATIDQLAIFVTDGEHATPPRTEAGVYLLSARNVRDGFLDLSKVDYISDSTHEALQKRVSVKAGDVLLSCSGSVGRSCVFPENLEASFVRSVAIIRPATVDSKYLSYCLRSPDLQSQVQDRITTTGQPNIFQGKIKTLSIPVAPPSEQAEIVNRIDHAFAWLDKIATEHARAEHLLPKLDQTILAKAFRGELVPQDPNDEPASVLLERIKATPTGTAPRRKKASN